MSDKQKRLIEAAKAVLDTYPPDMAWVDCDHIKTMASIEKLRAAIKEAEAETPAIDRGALGGFINQWMADNHSCIDGIRGICPDEAQELADAILVRLGGRDAS